MSFFLRKVLLFAVFISLILILLLYFLDFRFKNNKVSKYGWVLSFKSETFDFAFHGSSRTNNMLNTTLFEKLSKKKCINIGTSGSGLADNFLLLHLFLKKNNNRVKTLLFQIDAFSLDSKNSFSYPFNEYIYIPYIHDGTVKSTIKEQSPRSSFFLWEIFPPIAYLEFNSEYDLNQLIKGFKTTSFYDRTKGYSPTNRIALDIEDLNYPITKGIDTTDMKYLKKIIKLCKTTNTNLILYTAPIYDYNKYFKIEKSDSVIVNLAKSSEVFYFDLKQQDGFDKSSFSDITHLNRKGVDRFTALLLNTIQREAMPHPSTP